MLLLSTRDSWWMSQCEAALLAEGVSMRWVSGPFGSVMLEVEDADAERSSTILSELLSEELKRPAAVAVPTRPPLLLQPAFAMALSLAVLTLLFYWITASAPATDWDGRGALLMGRVMEGEWWRVITAATLHADLAHALSNAAFFVVLGWAAGERLGPGLALFVWLLTAVCGFVVSLLLSDISATVGASGGLFGLLGAAAGHALRHRRASGDAGPWRGRWRALLGAVLLMAFTAFSRRANIHAHVGGFCFGVLFGFTAPRRPLNTALQAALGLSTALAVLWAWSLAR